MSERNRDLGSRLIETAIREIRDIAASLELDVGNRLNLAADLVAEGRRASSRDLERESVLGADVAKLAAEMSPGHAPPSLYAAAVDLLGGEVDLGTATTQTDEVDDVVPAELTADEVRDYLRVRFPAAADEVFEVSTIHGGYSKRTTMVDCTVDGKRTWIVLRQVPAGRSARSLTPEFSLLQALYGRDLPVPRPLWMEPEDNSLGGAFFVTERAPGSNVGDVWGGRGVSAETCLHIAELYAALHSVDPDGVAVPVSPRLTSEDLLAMIEWQESTLVKRGIEIDPVLGSLLTWSRLNVPDAPVNPSILHGDAAFSNLLVEGDRVTSILDWEAAHVGNPAEELAYLRPTVEPVIPWDEFIGRYTGAGGHEPDPHAMHFFTVWSYVWRHIGCLWLAQNFESTGRHASAIAGHVLGPRFLRSAVEAAFGPGSHK